MNCKLKINYCLFLKWIIVINNNIFTVIGRGGEQITRLQSETGCKIQMAPESGLPERVCTLTGSREAVK